MSKDITAIIGMIFFTALVAGIFTGASIKSGEDINPDSLLVKTLGTFCDSVKDVDVAYNTCRQSFIMLTILVFIAGIVEIITTASKLGNFWIGMIIYGVGWLIGLLLLILLN